MVSTYTRFQHIKSAMYHYGLSCLPIVETAVLITVATTTMSLQARTEAHEKRPLLVSHREIDAFANQAPTSSLLPKSQVKVGFIGETEIILSWIEGDDSPVLALDEHRPKRPLFLTYERYVLKRGVLTLLSHDQINAATVHDSINVLPSGRILINAGEEISLHSLGKIIARRSVKDLCGPVATNPDGSTFDAELYPSSDELGVVKLNWRMPSAHGWVDEKHVFHPPRPVPEKSFYCWFNPENLSTVAVASSPLSFPGGSAAGLSVYSGPPGHIMEFSPTGIRKVELPLNCDIPSGTVDMRDPYLLRSGKGAVTVCAGELDWQFNGRTRKVKLPRMDHLPIIIADSWQTPILALATGKIRQIQGAALILNNSYMFVDYETGGMMELKTKTHVAQGFLLAAQPIAMALSNDGRYVALFENGQLWIYITDFSR